MQVNNDFNHSELMKASSETSDRIHVLEECNSIFGKRFIHNLVEITMEGIRSVGIAIDSQLAIILWELCKDTEISSLGFV
jgi:hypothetical protein